MLLYERGEEFDSTLMTYSAHLEKNVAFNMYKNGWWDTFRYLPLKDSNIVESKQCFVDIASRLDLSSLKWTKGTLTHRTTAEPEEKIDICE